MRGDRSAASELSAVTIFARGFEVWRRQLLPLAGIVWAAQQITGTAVNVIGFFGCGAVGADWPGPSVGDVITFTLLMFLAVALAAGATVVVARRCAGKRSGAFAAIGTTFARTPALALLTILLCVRLLVPIVVAIVAKCALSSSTSAAMPIARAIGVVGGAFVVVRHAAAPGAVVVEGLDAFAALTRGARLTVGSRRTIFGALCLGFVVGGVALWATTFALYAGLPSPYDALAYLAALCALLPFPFTIAGAVYHDLRVVKEGASADDLLQVIGAGDAEWRRRKNGGARRPIARTPTASDGAAPR